jgi:tetratricopeptide (TPR) repeat protein
MELIGCGQPWFEMQIEYNEKKALQYFLKTLKLNPNYRDAVLNCGSILTSLGQSEEAKRLYASYLKSNLHD